MNPTAQLRELSFLDHLEELRLRLLRSLLYWFLGTAGAWVIRGPLLEVMRWPAEAGARAVGLPELAFRIFDPAGGFMLMMQIALVAGLVIALPLVFLEVWLFIRPALEPHERRWVVFMLPAAVALFVAGMALCYLIAPRVFEFFFRINLSMGVEAELTLASHLRFMLRMLLVFGFCFELPLVIVFLGVLGFVSSDWLMTKWRWAVVLAMIIGAVATPNDPLTMVFLAGPMLGLHFLSVWVLRLIERRRARAQARGEQREAEHWAVEGEPPEPGEAEGDEG